MIKTDVFWELLDKKYRPEITYEDWLSDQMQLILAHPAGYIFQMDPVKVNVKPTRILDDKRGPHVLDMDNSTNNHWKFFTLLSQKNYNVMIKLEVSHYIDRNTSKWTTWVDFSKFNEYLASRSYSPFYKLSIIKWRIKHPLTP